MSREEKNKPTYIMVPRKLIRAWISTTFVLIIMNIASFQYTNYVDRQSNSFLCGIIAVFDDTYKKSPPRSDTGKLLAPEITQARSKFKCIQ